MADTFQIGATTATFNLLVPGHSLDSSGRVSVRKAPSGNVYVDLAGDEADTLSGIAEFATNADYTTLRDLAGSTGGAGTLTRSEETRSAVLLRVSRTWRKGTRHLARVEFVLL
jgi:hypothetical protein